MNLWLLTTEFPPQFGGGIATYAYHTARMLSQRGHWVTVFTLAEDLASAWHVEEFDEHLRVVRFGAGQSPQSQALGPWVRWSYDAALVLKAFIRQEGAPDILESQEYLGFPYFTLLRRWLREDELGTLPIAITAHTPLYLCRRYDEVSQYRFPDWWVGEMERFSLLAADGVAFPSAYLQKAVLEGLPQIADCSWIVPNPFQVQQNDEVITGTRRGFLFTAKLERRKGIEELLTAFARLWKDGLEEPLILMGDDWYDGLRQRWMSEFIAQHYGHFIRDGLLQWRGKQPPAMVLETLNEVRAMILPSRFENFPYAVLEAMALGCPVIVSSSGGHAEIVDDGINGFVFSHSRPGDLETKVQALINLSDVEWQNMAEAARHKVTKISGYDVVAPEKEAVLEEIIERVTHCRAKRHFPFLREIPSSKRGAEEESEEEKDLLSIVIPFFNLGDYIEDTLRSLEGLSGISHEIIVVDDGSYDPASIQKLEELRQRYPFRLVRTHNQGLAMARNTGAREAKGEFLAFLDADDCVDVTYYHRAIDILKCYDNVSFVGCWAEYWGEAEGYWPTWNPEPPYVLIHNPINTSALIYRRADFLRFGLNDPQFKYGFEDYDSMLSLLENGCRGVAIPEPYFKYRVRGASMYHQASLETRVVSYEWLTQKHASFYREFADEVVALLSSNGPGYLYDNPTQWYPMVGFLSPEIQARQAVGMPSAPARVYLYFGLRALFLPPYQWLREKFPIIEKFKCLFKRIFVGDK